MSCCYPRLARGSIVTCPGTVLSGCPTSERQPHLGPAVWRLGSGTWLKTQHQYRQEFLLPCNCTVNWNRCILKLLRLGMVPHSKLSHLATLLPSGTSVCSLTIPLSGGSAWNREQNASKVAGRGNLPVIMGHMCRNPLKNTTASTIVCRLVNQRLF